MPNFKSFLKSSSSVNTSNKKKQQQQQPSSALTSKKSRDEKSPPRFGLFHRHSRSSGGKNAMRKSGSQSLMMCSSTLSIPGSGVSSPGIPKCNTVANFSQMGVTTVPSPPPSKCNSVATFAALGPSLRTSLASLSLSRCASAVGLGIGSSGFQKCRSCASLASSRRGSTLDVSSSESPLQFCRLCLCDVRMSEMVSLQQCSCQYCRCCLQQYLAFQVMDGNLQISCPDAACSQQGIVTQDEMELLLDDELCERYQRFLLNHEVDLDPTRVWCPKAGCETICPVPQEGSTSCLVQCTTCGHKFCSQCKARWHANQTCDAYARKRAKMAPTEDEPLACYEESGSIKRCPLCRIPIERNAGCAQMMCKRCKHVFCWYCLTSLDDDFMLRHYDKGPCKNKLGHSRASLLWHRTQVVGIFAGLGVLLLVASPLLLIVAPCILCSNCKGCDLDDDVATTTATSTSTPTELTSPKTV